MGQGGVQGGFVAGVAPGGSDALLRGTEGAQVRLAFAGEAPRRPALAEAEPQPASRQPATSTTAPSRSAAIRRREAATAPVHIRLKGRDVGRGQRRRAQSQPNATMGAFGARCGQRPCCSWRRSAPIDRALGMSMPVTSSATLRRASTTGQAPTQMPQLAHRSALTCAISRPMRLFGCGIMVTRRRGQSSKQRRQPLAVGRIDHRHRTGTLRPGRKGRANGATSVADHQPPHHASRAGVDQQVARTAAASRRRAAPAPRARLSGARLITGRATASASSPRSRPRPAGAAGNPRRG